MRESEIKARCSAETLEELEAYLLGGSFFFKGEQQQEDVYYDHPCRSFAATDEAVRLRRVSGTEGAFASFAYKGPNLAHHGQEREELETGVEDPAAMDAALQRLGFRTVAAVRKQRKTLKNGDVTVCLDKVEGLGCFFELEILGAEDAAARLEAMLKEVSFLPWEVENRTYLELLLL